MTKTVSAPLAVGLAVALALPACRKSEPAPPRAAAPRPAAPAREGDPVAKLLAHTDAMIEILKVNEADPARALQELNAYQQRNQAEIEREKAAMSEIMQRDPIKIAAASSLYGMKSTELEARTKEATARARAK